MLQDCHKITIYSSRLFRKIYFFYIVVSVFNVSVNQSFAFSDTPHDIANSEKIAFEQVSLLTQEKGKEGFLSDDVIRCDFGVVDFLDTEIRNEQIDHLLNVNEATDEYLSGIKRYFYLVNNSDEPITVAEATSECICATVKRIEGKRFLDFPCTIKPKEKVEVVLAFDYTSAIPGKVESTVHLVDQKGRRLTQFLVLADLKSGIEFSPQKLDFGRINAGTKSQRFFSLKIDRRLPVYMMKTEPLQLVTVNKNIRVTSIPSTIEDKNIKIVNDKIAIKTAGGVTFDKDLILKFRVELLDTAPIEKIHQEIKLSLPSSPGFSLLYDAKLEVDAVVVGNMRVAPSNIVVFGTLNKQTSAKRITNISCGAPLTPSSLRVASSNKYVTVRLILPPALKPGEKADPKKPRNVAKLEMTLSADAPIGQQNGKVTVTNTVNKERIEIRTYAAVIK